MNATLLDNSHTLRTSILSGLSLFSAISAFFFAIFNVFYYHSYLLTSLELLYSFYSIYLYLLTKREHYSHHHIKLYVYFGVTIITLATYTLPISNSVLLWSLLCPILLYVLLGLKQGQLITGVVLIIQIVNILYKEPQFTNPTLINLTLCYSGIWLIAHIYEFNRSRIENSLTYLASRDSLTGTHNRLSLRSAFQNFMQHKESSPALCLLILDLDYFKQINDEFGHDAGDKVLIEISHLLTHIVGDSNVYRIGGEEFCITLFNQPLEQAELVGEKLRNTVANHLFLYQSKKIHLTLSLGICKYRHGDTLSELLKLADMELYRAKKNGRNQVRICRPSDVTEYSTSQVDLV